MPTSSSTQPAASLRTAASWPRGPSEPGLGSSELHVWRADLSAGAQTAGLLSDPEHARAKRIVSPLARRRWRVARGILRELLGRYTQSDPRTLRLAAGAHGKPVLATCSPLHFNLSHSGDLALYALSNSDPVGVDVELARSVAAPLGLAARMFGASTARRLEQLDPASREREFLRAWVAHEASLKCGERTLPAAAGQSPEGQWLTDLEMGPRAFAALAAARAPDAVSCWAWSPQARGVRGLRKS